LFILHHNFSTRNASRKSIKVSKDTDSSLVSIENWSKILPCGGWAQIRYQQPKMAKNLKPKNFIFIADLTTCPKSFQGLNSSLVQSDVELCIC